MSEIAVIQNKQPLAQARDYTSSQLALIRQTVAKDTTVDEFNMFVEICKRQNLDPFRRQIYALVFNKDKPTKRQVAFVTGIDGYRAMAKRTGTYRPSDEDAIFDVSEEASCPDSNPAGIVSCTHKVYQFGPDKKWYPIVATVKWAEFAPIYEEKEFVTVLDDDGNAVLQTEGNYAGRPKKELRPTGKVTLTKENWRKMPFVMIAKCAEAQALRKGWPEEMGGFYVAEEMDSAILEDQTATELVDRHEEEQRLRRVNAKDTIPVILNMTEGLQMVPEEQFCDAVLAHLSQFESVDDVEFWREQNKAALQQFWAKHGDDALSLKKEIEKITTKLKGKNDGGISQ